MSGPDELDQASQLETYRAKTNPSAKKTYQKPEFRFERVFETRALSCGKVSVTQQQCVTNRKTS